MHKSLFAFVALLCSCSDSGTTNEPEQLNEKVQLGTTPATTAVADPTGAPVHATFGAQGGTLRSADGRLEVVVPAGAVTTDTAFTVTPLGDVAPGAVGSWRLGPEGTTFTEPVTLRFHPTEADLAGSVVDALELATQDQERHWQSLGATVEGDGIRATTTHFSDFSALVGFQLRPGSATVKPGESLGLEVRYCQVFDDGELVGLVAECQEDGLMPLVTNWSVNGTAGGNAEVGTVSATGTGALYKAPNEAPSDNPVAVSVQFAPPKGKKPRTTLVSNVTVSGASPYAGNVTFKIVHPGATTIEGSAELQFRNTRVDPTGISYTLASGTFTATFTADKCKPVKGTYPIEDAKLEINPAGNAMFPNTYFFNFEAAPTIPLECTGADGKPFTVDLPFTTVVGAGFCDGATPVPYTDDDVLSGEGPCATMSVVSSTWSLRKQQ